MKRVGQVDIPQEAFLAAPKVSSSEEDRLPLPRNFRRKSAAVELDDYGIAEADMFRGAQDIPGRISGDGVTTLQHL